MQYDFPRHAWDGAVVTLTSRSIAVVTQSLQHERDLERITRSIVHTANTQSGSLKLVETKTSAVDAIGQKRSGEPVFVFPRGFECEVANALKGPSDAFCRQRWTRHPDAPFNARRFVESFTRGVIEVSATVDPLAVFQEAFAASQSRSNLTIDPRFGLLMLVCSSEQEARQAANQLRSSHRFAVSRIRPDDDIDQLNSAMGVRQTDPNTIGLLQDGQPSFSLIVGSDRQIARLHEVSHRYADCIVFLNAETAYRSTSQRLLDLAHPHANVYALAASARRASPSEKSDIQAIFGPYLCVSAGPAMYTCPVEVVVRQLKYRVAGPIRAPRQLSAAEFQLWNRRHIVESRQRETAVCREVTSIIGFGRHNELKKAHHSKVRTSLAVVVHGRTQTAGLLMRLPEAFVAVTPHAKFIAENHPQLRSRVVDGGGTGVQDVAVSIERHPFVLVDRHLTARVGYRDQWIRADATAQPLPLTHRQQASIQPQQRITIIDLRDPRRFAPLEEYFKDRTADYYNSGFRTPRGLPVRKKARFQFRDVSLRHDTYRPHKKNGSGKSPKCEYARAVTARNSSRGKNRQPLISEVANFDILSAALTELCRQSQHSDAADVYGVRPSDLSRRDRREACKRLSVELRTGAWRPGREKRAEVRKSCGKRREIWIPPVLDRVVQRVLSGTLLNHWPRSLKNYSWATEGRSAHAMLSALKTAIEAYESPYLVVVDIANAFGSVQVDDFMNVCDEIGLFRNPKFSLHGDRMYFDPPIDAARQRDIFRNTLERAVIGYNGNRTGITQGSALSPFVLDRLLDSRLDRPLVESLPTLDERKYFRYVDDVTVVCPSRESGVETVTRIKELLQPLGMKLRDSENDVIDLSCGEAATVLGTTVRHRNGLASWEIPETVLTQLLADLGSQLPYLGEDQVLRLIQEFLSYYAPALTVARHRNAVAKRILGTTGDLISPTELDARLLTISSNQASHIAGSVEGPGMANLAISSDGVFIP